MGYKATKNDRGQNGQFYTIKCFSRLLYTRWQELSTLHSGDMLTRIIKDTDDVINVIVTTFPLAISAGVQFIGALVILFILDPILALILGIGMPLLALLGGYIIRKCESILLRLRRAKA